MREYIFFTWKYTRMRFCVDISGSLNGIIIIRILTLFLLLLFQLSHFRDSVKRYRHFAAFGEILRNPFDLRAIVCLFETARVPPPR